MSTAKMCLIDYNPNRHPHLPGERAGRVGWGEKRQLAIKKGGYSPSPLGLT